MNRLERLHDAGVSIWLDTLSRELLDRGRSFCDSYHELLDCIETKLRRAAHATSARS